MNQAASPLSNLIRSESHPRRDVTPPRAQLHAFTFRKTSDGGAHDTTDALVSDLTHVSDVELNHLIRCVFDQSLPPPLCH